MANYRVKIGSTDLSLPSSVIEVGWDSVISYNPDTDSEAYKDEIKSEMVMNCARMPTAWNEDKVAMFMTLDEASEECAVFQVIVEVECPKDSDTWDSIWEGEFSSKNWRIDKDKKTISFQPVKEYPADCIRAKWTDIYNFYALDEVIVKPYFLQLQLTQQIVTLVPDNEPCEDYLPGSDPTGYCYESTQEATDPGEDTKNCIFFYHRYLQSGTCSGSTPVPPDDWNTWTLEDNNCPGAPPTYWTCPAEINTIVYRFGNGRLFNDAIEQMLSDTGCGFTVKSDFFNINPDGTAPSNAAYTAAIADLHHLVIFQKSDIKRHSASDPSQEPAWDVKLREVLTDLALMFNVRWKAADGVFRIEHVSYFEAQSGNDYTTAKYERILEENTLEVANITKFKYRDARATDYFNGNPIEIYCGIGEAEKQASLFYCDVGFALTTDGLEAVGDDGFFLMSTYIDGGEYRLLRQNRGLSWTELHQNYHRHDMPGAGKINLTEVTPLSIRKTRKAPRFAVTHCCDDTFNPENFITTSMGEGEVVTADWNIARDYLAPELKY